MCCGGGVGGGGVCVGGGGLCLEKKTFRLRLKSRIWELVAVQALFGNLSHSRQGTVARTSSGKTSPQPSQIAESLWIDSKAWNWCARTNLQL